MHYNHTQTNEPPPPFTNLSHPLALRSAHSLSLPKSRSKIFITRRFHLNLLAVYIHQRKTMSLAIYLSEKKRVRGKSEKGHTKVTLDDLGDQGGVGESHSLEGLGVLFFFFL